MHRKAAALVQSMVTNHGFVDGNKRTTLILTYTLIVRSGYDLVAAEEDGDIETEFEDLLLSVSDRLPFEEIVQWFRGRLVRADYE